MIYAMAGIPLWLIMFQSAGERLNALITFLLSHVKRRFRRRGDVSDIELITVEFALSTCVVLGCSLVFSSKEKWTYFESIYYSFITLSTIGFGDFVPLASLQKTNQSLYSKFGYVIFTIGFILVGLTIMASSINLLVLRLVAFNTEEAKAQLEEVVARQASIDLQHYDNISLLAHTNQKLLVNNHQQLTNNNTNRVHVQPSTSLISLENSRDRQLISCCYQSSLLRFRTSRKRYKIRRSPANIKHLLYIGNILENNTLYIQRTENSRNIMTNNNHISEGYLSSSKRISL
ncbi:unnamed protein product [Didymodactylos carnosus]|nr:unnamed protein product [Didymodactylos carnosus]CAF3651847.1 unnamed protein product [Didymodactylos carnosus]